MTMTDKLREAAQQALEALEYTMKPLCMCWAGCENCDPSKAPDIEKAITDLRAALAQQPEPVSAADLVQRIRELRDEAAKMFIESGSPGYKLHDLYRMKLDAILVAPPQQPEPVQKPVAWRHKGAGHFAVTPLVSKSHEWEPLYTTPPQQPEPVAYIHRQGRYWEASERPLTDDEKARGWTEEPLYTAPPQRPRLTDAEMLDIIDNAMEGGSLLDLVRAIERKVRGE